MFDGIDTTAQVLFIDPAQLVGWAARVRPHLQKMADGSGGRYLACDILTLLASGRMQLWLGVRGADLLCVMVSEIHDYPRLRALRMIGLVGHRPREWRHLLEDVERFARERFGCVKAEAMHIPKFARLLPGYNPTHHFAEKTL